MELNQENFQHMRDKLSKLKNKHIASGLVDQIVGNMHSNICQGLLQVSNTETQFPIVKNSEKSDVQSKQQKLNEILQKKEYIKKQLAAIEEEADQINRQKLQISRMNDGASKYYKSQVTAEDIQKLKKLKAEQKKFQKQLAEKTQQYEQRMKKIKQEEEIMKQKQRKQKYEIKKQQIQKTIELIEKRKNERLNRLEQEKKTMKQIINRKKLHQQWNEKWKAIEQQQQKKKQELKQEIRKLRKISYEQIRQHEKKYQQTMKTQKQSRLRNSINPVDGGNLFYRSAFLEHIMQQQKKIKQDEELKKQAPKQFLNKIKEYNEKVKNYHKPILKQGQASQIDKQNIKEEEVRSMSLFQTHKKGNEYMRSVNSQIAQASKKKDPNLNIKNEPEPFKYKNYLKELKKPESSQDISKKSSQLSQIKQILKKQSLTQQQKFFQAKNLAQKYEKRQVVRSPQGLVQSINAKIQILRQVDV